MDAGNPGLHNVTYFRSAMEILSGHQSGVAVINSHKRAELLAYLVDGSFDAVVLFIRRLKLQILVHVHGRAETAALVDIEGHQNLLALMHPAGLFPEGQQQILLQPPVQKSTDFAHLSHLQDGQAAQLQLWFICSGNQAGFGILVHKDRQLRTNLRPLRHLLLRQQHALLRALLLT